MGLHYFNSSEPISGNNRSDLMEFLKKCFKKGHCDLNAVSSNEVKLKNRIYNIRCLGSIIINNLWNNVYFLSMLEPVTISIPSKTGYV